MPWTRFSRTPRSRLLTAAAACFGLTCGLGTAGSPGAPVDDESGSPPAKRPVDVNATPIKIAFISYANPQQVAKDSGAVCKYLEPFVGVPVEGFITMDYGSSVEAMRSQQADLAFVDPLAFMMAHEQIGAKPLVLEVYPTNEPSYYSCIWVRKDSGIDEVEDLRDRVIAFADQVDMSGHLLPRDIFVSEGLLPADRLEGTFFKQVYFAGGDEQAIRAVYNGFVDAAGISQFAYLLLRPEERDEITVIGRSIDSPSHLVMARKDLPDETCERIKQALLALDPKKADEKALLERLYGVRGFVAAEMSDFAEVANIAARYGFIRKPETFARPPLGPGQQDDQESKR